jgi:aldose 1-epimerase
MKLTAVIFLVFTMLATSHAEPKYILRNHHGMTATFTTYGARLVSLTVPDKNGKPTNVVLGFDSDSAYAHSTEPYFGATIGRYGNRIAKGKFTLDGSGI